MLLYIDIKDVALAHHQIYLALIYCTKYYFFYITGSFHLESLVFETMSLSDSWLIVWCWEWRIALQIISVLDGFSSYFSPIAGRSTPSRAAALDVNQSFSRGLTISARDDCALQSREQTAYFIWASYEPIKRLDSYEAKWPPIILNLMIWASRFAM